MRSNKLLIDWLKWPLYFRIVLIVMLIVLLFGQVISLIEPEVFPTVFDGIWWALVTVSTVGFGDYVPKTVAGRFVGMVLILIGAGFVTTYFATLSAAAFQKQHSYLKGDTTFKHGNHIVIIGWNEKTSELIETFQKIKPYKNLVLIDDTLEESPLIENLHFIRGNPTIDRTLVKANIEHADAAIITANQHKNESDADMHSILILLALKGINPDLYTVIELVTGMHLNNAKRAGADEIIKSYQLSSHLMMNSYLAKYGLSSVYSELNPANGNYFKIEPIPEELIGETFHAASHALLEKELLLIGIKKGDKTKLNPPISQVLHQDDLLILITH
ncbi:potassium channel family protein [Metabacillus idriensis]|uniref:potassium channel family protein n=1 Tax=Metabacillus idriensis TaxID=324768 RepID=UPI00281295E2|nr:potassium channel family protein [Metabacillus idriensis]MDR0140017.1 potassium channel family protein [Metabacillus idriensis]